VVEHFGGHASLVVEYEGETAQLADGPAEERAFVDVGVNDVGLEVDDGALHGGGEGEVEIKLVTGGADHDASLPGDIDGAADLDTGHIGANVVSAEEDSVAAALEMPYLLQYTDVRAVVREEGSGCYG